MKISKENIDAIEAKMVSEIVSASWDSVTDTDHNYWLANMMYLTGVHDMAEELRKAVKELGGI